MKHESFTELLERRVVGLRRLAGDLLAAQQALVRWDLEAVEEHTAAQEQSCRELLQIDTEILTLSQAPARQDAGACGPRALAKRDVAILQELELLRREVLQINNVQAEFLKRSRRSLNVLSNVVRSALGVYEPSRPEFLPAPERGR